LLLPWPAQLHHNIHHSINEKKQKSQLHLFIAIITMQVKIKKMSKIAVPCPSLNPFLWHKAKVLRGIWGTWGLWTAQYGWSYNE
jgi:hypothetical protein